MGGVCGGVPDSPPLPISGHGRVSGVCRETESEGLVDRTEIQWAAANWINDDWAWRLFGARSFDDRRAGTFTAYLEIPAGADEFVDCRASDCAIYTRNDHTAIDNRMQDLYLPVEFSK